MRSSDLCYDEEHEKQLLREEGYDMAIEDTVHMVSDYMAANLKYSDEQIANALISMFLKQQVEEESWIPALRRFYQWKKRWSTTDMTPERIDELIEKNQLGNGQEN